MKIRIFSTHPFEEEYIEHANEGKHQLFFTEKKLDEHNVEKAAGCEAIAVFVSDDVSAANLQRLKSLGVRYIALRSAGFNHLDLPASKELGIKAARVPAYSPNSVAEHAVTLMLALNRKIVEANRRVNHNDFSLDGLVGFDMKGKTVGIIGTGNIGRTAARILNGFGCKLLGYDKCEQDTMKALGMNYTDLGTLCRESDIITLHVPLNNETHYLINEDLFSIMKQGVMLINTGRGGLLNTREAIGALETGRIGSLGLDVYEHEKPLFFEDHSSEKITDELFKRLKSFENVLITGHQGFLTREALQNIAASTIHNLDCFEKGVPSGNEL
jgi:D-lactate dehydrogenase